MIVVSQNNFEDVIEVLLKETTLFLDTETTGLNVYGGDRLFSIQIGTLTEVYYFNFQDYEEFEGDDTYWLSKLEHGFRLNFHFFENNLITWVIQNAKFDMAMLRAEGWALAGPVHDTMTVERIVDSETQLGQFSLNVMGSKLGLPKDTGVEQYIAKHKLWTLSPDGKSKRLHYDRVPWELIVPYGCRDIEVLRAVYLSQMKSLEAQAALQPSHLPTVMNVLREDRLLIKTVGAMEERGVLIDRPFCEEAIEHYRGVMGATQGEFKGLTGEDFMVSGPLFAKIFESEKERWQYGEPTKKGIVNPCFDADVLETFEHPAARVILNYKNAKSSIDYYLGFLKAADKNDRIHASFNQHGANTGRFSSNSPNLQNLTKSEGDDLLERFVVRRAVIPAPGNVFHMLDYKQQEYRVLFEYAGMYASDDHGVMRIIKAIYEGHDVHQVTADFAGITRSQAKNANFALVFGAGDEVLAGLLRSSVEVAMAMRASIYKTSPEMKEFIKGAIHTAKTRGTIINWFGRRYNFSDPKGSFKAPNKLCQGGGADIVKVAMNQCEDYLKNFKTKLCLQIHDELVFEGPPEEASTVIPVVKSIMEKVFPAKYVPLVVDVEHSFRSLADKAEGIAS